MHRAKARSRGSQYNPQYPGRFDQQQRRRERSALVPPELTATCLDGGSVGNEAGAHSTKDKKVSRNFTSWNQLDDWLQQVDVLRQAA